MTDFMNNNTTGDNNSITKTLDDTVDSYIIEQSFNLGNPHIERINGTIHLIKANFNSQHTDNNNDLQQNDHQNNNDDNKTSEDIDNKQQQQQQWKTIINRYKRSNNNNNNSIQLISNNNSNSYNASIDTTNNNNTEQQHDDIDTSDDLDLGTDILLMSNVPTYMTLNELNLFIQPSLYCITHIQLINIQNNDNNNNNHNAYSILLKFINTQCTAKFVRQYSYKQFNTLDSQLCELAYVFSIVLNNNNNNTNHNIMQPFISNDTNNNDSNIMPDIGSCAVCLESLNSNNSNNNTSIITIITILCTHTFHIDCISQWSESSSCPVCRYVIHPVESSTCSICNATTQLWLCLLCGDIGCSRYLNGHAMQHYQNTGHNYSQELATRNVWDYTNDTYVHRLIQNKTDNKIVEFNNNSSNSSDLHNKHNNSSNSLSSITAEQQHENNKLEHMLSEYNYMLSIELEQQRMYYNNNINAIRKQHNNIIDELTCKISSIQYNIQQLQYRYDELQSTYTMHNIVNEQLDNKITQANKQYDQLKLLNNKLVEQQNKQQNDHKLTEQEQYNIYNKLLKDKDDEIQLLQEQIHDIQQHITTQKQINKSDIKHDITAGQLFVADNADIQDNDNNVNKYNSTKQRLLNKLHNKRNKK